MIFQGRNLDVLSLWNSLGVDFPDLPSDSLPTYMSKVRCPNPAHDTHKRHFQVNTRKPLVHCFAHCGISGSYEHAVAIILGLRDDKGEPDERAARRVILKHTRVALRGTVSAYEGRGQRKSFDADSHVAMDEKRLTAGDYQYIPADARAYLDNRGIDAASRGKWRIGFDEDADRIVIPAFDERGVFKFIIRRSIRGNTSLKYLYTKGVLKTSILFGVNLVNRERVQQEGLVLVEGSLDCIKLHQLGVTNAVAILGTGISKKQSRIVTTLKPRRLYAFFDKDSAGIDNLHALRKALPMYPISVVRYPKHRSDPAEMTKQEVQKALTNALPYAQFRSKTRNTLTKEMAHAS